MKQKEKCSRREFESRQVHIQLISQYPTIYFPTFIFTNILMLNYLFPIAMFTDVNKEIVAAAQKIFEECPPNSIRSAESSPGMKTTLQEGYSPMKTKVDWDPLHSEVSAPLINYIKESVNQFCQEADYAKHEIIISNMWLNEMYKGSQHPAHTHYGYTLSGVFYVDVPDNSGKIMFHHPQDTTCTPFIRNVSKWALHNSLSWWVPVETGSIIIFPANLRHSVPALDFEGARRSIAFDIVLIP